MSSGLWDPTPEFTSHVHYLSLYVSEPPILVTTKSESCTRPFRSACRADAGAGAVKKVKADEAIEGLIGGSAAYFEVFSRRADAACRCKVTTNKPKALPQE